MTTTRAQAVGDWWAEQIISPQYRATDAAGDGKDHEVGLWAGGMQSIIANDHPVDRDLAKRFADELARQVEDRLGRDERPILATDYGPDQVLADVADRVGVHQSRFPWKTTMWVRPDHVTASAGYGGREALIWSAPDWERPACAARHYEMTDKVYVIHDEICTRLRYHDGDCGDWQPDPARCDVCGGTWSDHYGDTRTVTSHVWKQSDASNHAEDCPWRRARELMGDGGE